MEANEKTPVPDGHNKMDVLPEVYLWYHPRLWTQIYCPLKSYTEMYLLKWCVYPVEKSFQKWNKTTASASTPGQTQSDKYYEPILCAI